MARTTRTVRKATGGQRPARRLSVHVWHPLLIAAADLDGSERLAAALAAKAEAVDGVHFEVDRNGEHRHPDSAQEGSDAGGASGSEPAPPSPFPPLSDFGLLPYAAFRGHEEVVAGFCEAGFDPEGTARVR